MTRKAQTNMIILVILLLVFIGIASILFSLSGKVSQEDYLSLYAHNLMLSVMRTDTGYTDSDCKTISDTMFCAFTLTNKPCGSSGLTCYEVANQSLTEYIKAFKTISKNYRYLFEVTPVFCSRGEEGCRHMEFGDKEVLNLGNKRTANSAIQKSMAGKPYNIKVRLYMARV
jgi:hypothetical protein